jgi:hypothetical protein
MNCWVFQKSSSRPFDKKELLLCKHSQILY